MKTALLVLAGTPLISPWTSVNSLSFCWRQLMELAFDCKHQQELQSNCSTLNCVCMPQYQIISWIIFQNLWTPCWRSRHCLTWSLLFSPSLSAALTYDNPQILVMKLSDSQMDLVFNGMALQDALKRRLIQRWVISEIEPVSSRTMSVIQTPCAGLWELAWQSQE